ncbi:MAG: holo-acyl-carrier-protein synthase [Eubacterium sp.]|nr:holo-acyl-carrier-protein synthase [Eubacterium sp.]
MELLLGTDIIEVDRIKASLEGKADGRFSARVFTPEEVKYCESKNASRYQSYAARFAGKEAVSKAFGTGIGENALFNEIEILNDKNGKPYVNLYGRAKKYYESLGASGISITLSHCKEYAVAYVAITINKA